MRNQDIAGAAALAGTLVLTDRGGSKAETSLQRIINSLESEPVMLSGEFTVNSPPPVHRQRPGYGSQAVLRLERWGDQAQWHLNRRWGR